jgi:hypothetical protein
MDLNDELARIIFELQRATNDLKELNDKLEQEDKDE